MIIAAGPTSAWINKAKENADLIFSGNTSMIDDFAKKIPSLSLENLSVLNVRPNNPKNIKNFEDILKDGVNVMVDDGVG